MQGGIEEIGRDGDVRFDEVTTVRQNSPRKLMLACIMVIRRCTVRRGRWRRHEPWSCSASGAVAARRSEMHKTLPRHEKPYLDSDRIATP
jgi:hypothetical protein